MEYLNCSSNPLHALNLEGLNRLSGLHCYDTQLTSLDVSNNTSLVYLSCSWNRLSSLDISGLDNLVMVACTGNELTDIQTDRNPSLEDIYCAFNRLTNLNVSGINGLQMLDCCRNRLTSLNVRGLKKLDDLCCYGNQLASLDITTTDVIKELVLSQEEYGTGTEDDYVYKIYGIDGYAPVLKVDPDTELITRITADPAKCKVFGFCRYQGKRYWFEDGVRQWVPGDPKNLIDTVYNTE